MKIKFYILSFSVLAVLILGACGPKVEEPHPVVAPPHLNYEGKEGPDHWGELDDAFALCGAGTSQSPIDVISPGEQNLANIAFHYQPSEVHILNNGHTAQVNYDAGSYLELDGVRYEVLQFHYHAPCEHAVDGRLFPAEIHSVHKNADGQLAVVGIFMDEGAENAAFGPFINNLSAEKADVKDAGVKINAADLLPSAQTTYRYKGSLTTPPCSEGVSWNLMTTPVELSSAQLSALKSLFEGGNNRPVQPLNDRPLLKTIHPKPGL